MNGHRLTETLANRLLDANNPSISQGQGNDPMGFMLSVLRNIAIRAALKPSQEETDKTVTLAAQTVPYIGRKTYSIYRMIHPSMILAVALNLLSIGLVCALLYGWWELGREVSMPPFESGKAFGSPLLAAADSNSSFEEYPDEIKPSVVIHGMANDHRLDGGAIPSQLMESLMVMYTTELMFQGTRYVITESWR